MNLSLFQNIINNEEYDFNLFCREYTTPCFNINGGIFNITELFSCCGPVISTNLNTSSILLNCPSPVKFFYIWDLEWIRIKDKNFSILSEIYNNKDFVYITRNNDYKKLIENCWGTKISYVFDNFEFLNNKEFINYVNEKRIPIHSRGVRIS